MAPTKRSISRRSVRSSRETTTTLDDLGDVTVKFTVEGKYLPARLYGDDAHPAEHPEVTVDEVLDANGKDVLLNLDRHDLQRVEQAAEAAAEDDAGDDDDRGYDDRGYDDSRDRRMEA